MSEQLLVAVLAALVCGAVGAAAPRVIGALPQPAPPAPREPAPEEPVTEPDPEPAPEPDPDPAPTYAEVAARPRLGLVTGLVSAVVGALLGYRYGWGWGLVPLLPLVPLGVWLGAVDLATRLLPRPLVYLTYAVAAVTIVVASLGVGEPRRIVWAVIGYLVWGGLFALLWFVYPAGMGFGDVRLAGALGLVMGFLGYDATFVAIVSAAILGGLGSVLLSALRLADRRHVPYGPFLLLGALLGGLVA